MVGAGKFCVIGLMGPDGLWGGTVVVRVLGGGLLVLGKGGVWRPGLPGLTLFVPAGVGLVEM